MKQRQACQFTFLSLLLIISCLVSGCFSRLPKKHVVYFNDFENDSTKYLTVHSGNGPIDSLKVVPFNNGKVFGFFNNNRIEFEFNGLPEHNTIKIEFDLLIHDKWDGDSLRPGSTVPDVWQMLLDGRIIYITTFSNGTHGQSFPGNYVNATAPSNPARANAWLTDLPGVCALKSQSNGSSLYKIELTTGHRADRVRLACNDALQPFKSFCAKSWSIDNLRLTAIYYN